MSVQPAPTPDQVLDPLWLRAVLHDLGAPLQLLSAIGEALTDDGTEAERRAAMLARLPGTIHRVSTRIYTLYDLVRDPQAQGPPEDFPVVDLARLAQSALPYLQAVARMRVQSRCWSHLPEVKVLVIDPAPVRLRPGIVDRIIENLVVNSAEAKAQKILIVVSRIEEQASLVVLDDGPGFHPVILEGPQAGQSLKEAGRGIGLAGVAVNVAQSGGTLELANLDDGSGARVQVRFPLASVEELERNDQELRELFARLVPGLIVLPEEKV